MPTAAASCPSCGAPLAASSVVSLERAGETTPAAADPPVSPVPSAAGSAPSSSAIQQGRFLPGTTVAGRYRVVGLLGVGGMGEVYRADDLVLGQAVALKFLPDAMKRSPEALERFRNEVRLARQVTHPGVCRVYDLGEVDGHTFLSMEYVDGEDLSSLLRRIGHLPEDKAAQLARQICAGLEAAHSRGILHRDLKPANVMVDGRGNARITDFGLAGMSSERPGGAGLEGTPAYMAPEVLEGRGASVQSDLYALGLLLYELFTGSRPFGGETLEEIARQHREARPPPPSEHLAGLDPAVEEAVLRCLEKDPARRPASALVLSLIHI